jgi:rubredoxin
MKDGTVMWRCSNCGYLQEGTEAPKSCPACKRPQAYLEVPVEKLSTLHKPKQEKTMKRYVCNSCGWGYDPATGDPDGGILPGTPFEELPADWVCPQCGAGKDEFAPE